MNGQPIKLNGNIHITCAILKLVEDSTEEAELGALFINAREAKVLQITLHKLGHPQPPTPIHVENTTAVGIMKKLNKTPTFTRYGNEIFLAYQSVLPKVS